MGLITSKKKKISEIIMEEIISMIKNGEIREGDKLPNQNVFASELGVSRPSLREALNQLAVAGIVEQKPGAGTILKIGNPDLWTISESPPLFSDVNGTLELLQARKELEPIVIKMAVDNMTEKEFDLITDSIKKMRLYYRNVEIDKYMKEDINFHCLIAQMCRNRFMTQMFLNLRRLMEELWRESINKLDDILENSLEHHERIYKTLKDRDREAAIQEITSHISDIEKKTIEYYIKNNMLE